MKTIKQILDFAFNSKPNRGNIGGGYRIADDGSFEIFYAGYISEKNGYTEPLLLRYGRDDIEIPKVKLHAALEEYLKTHEIKEYSLRDKFGLDN